MRAVFKVQVQKKTVTADGLAPEDAAAFRHFVPEGSFEMTDVLAHGGELPPKQRKELEAVRAFAGTKEFPEFIARYLGVAPAREFDLAVLWDGDDHLIRFLGSLENPCGSRSPTTRQIKSP